MGTCAILARDNVLAYGVHVADYSYRYFIVSLMLTCIITLLSGPLPKKKEQTLLHYHLYQVRYVLLCSPISVCVCKYTVILCLLGTKHLEA